MLGAVHQQSVVDLIGEDDQTVFLSHIGDLLKQILRVHSTGWVIGVDDDDSLGVGGDLLLYVVDIGVPARLLVADVVYCRTARKGHRSRPQRVVRGRDQHLVAGVQQTLHGHGDQLGNAVAGVDILNGHAGYALVLVIALYRLESLRDTSRIAVAHGSGQGV